MKVCSSCGRPACCAAHPKAPVITIVCADAVLTDWLEPVTVPQVPKLRGK